MPLTTPFAPPPDPDAKPLEPLSSEHEGKRLKVLEHFSDLNYEIPGTKGELDEQERFWLVSCQSLSISMALCFDCRATSVSSVVSVSAGYASQGYLSLSVADLTASNWEQQTAIRRLEDTLKWRREFGVYGLTAEFVEPEVVLI